MAAGSSLDRKSSMMEEVWERIDRADSLGMIALCCFHPYQSFIERALFFLISIGDIDSISFLLSCGVNKEIRNQSGRTLLHEAARAGYPDLIKKLCAEKVAIEAVDDESFHPLHLAVFEDDPDAIRALVLCGADLKAEDKAGRNALALARFFQCTQAEQMLLAIESKNAPEECRPLTRSATGIFSPSPQYPIGFRRVNIPLLDSPFSPPIDEDLFMEGQQILEAVKEGRLAEFHAKSPAVPSLDPLFLRPIAKPQAMQGPRLLRIEKKEDTNGFHKKSPIALQKKSQQKQPKEEERHVVPRPFLFGIGM